MELTKLVFVSVENAKPRRKVAIPVSEDCSWSAFCSQVQTKLKLTGVEAICLASTGAEINHVDQLQDIDELYAIEGKNRHINTKVDRSESGSKTSTSNDLSSYNETLSQINRLKAQATAPSQQSSALNAINAEKYSKRTGAAKRVLQKLLPSLFVPTLPTTRWAAFMP